MRLRYICVILLCCLLLPAVAQQPKDRNPGQSLRETMQALNEKAHSELTDGKSMSPQQYEDTIRALFREEKWHDAYPFLRSAEKEWSGVSSISCLLGRYWFHEGRIASARRYLLAAVKEDESNTEALEVLVRLEEQEENYATAIVHINDLLTWSPYNPRLWRKKIELYRLSGNEIEANRLLERLAVIYPKDEEIRKDLIYQKELEYAKLSKAGNERESQQAIEELISRNPNDTQYYIDLSSSYLKEGKIEDALAVCAKGVRNTNGNRTLIRRRVSILSDCARYQEAEQYLDDCIRRYGSKGLEEVRLYLREQAAFAADEADAYTRHKRLYATTDSDEALDWLITTSMQRGWWDDAQYYLKEAERKRGRDKQLLSKQYLVEKRQGNERAAARILEELYQIDSSDEEVREELAEKRLREGTDLMLDELWAQALVPLRQADSLTNDSDMHALLTRRIRTCELSLPDPNKDSLDWMQHSVIYEKEHNLDSAYAALMRYKPSLNEYHDVQRHRYTLQSQLMKNNITFEFQYARRSAVDNWTHNAYLTYSRQEKDNRFEFLAAYAGREGSMWEETTKEGEDTTYVSAGGTDVQLGAAYYHRFKWGELGGSASWASRFMPRATVKLYASEELPKNWTLSERLQWRYIIDEKLSYHVFSIGVSAAWTYKTFVLTPSIDLFLMQNHVYVNGGFKMTYFPLDGDRSNIFAAVGAGNAPDLSILDSNIPVQFANLNTNVSAGGQYLINGHLAVTGSVDWYVMGGSDDYSVRNYFYLHAGLIIFF